MRPVKEREPEEEGEVEVGVGTEGERLTADPAWFCYPQLHRRAVGPDRPP